MGSKRRYKIGKFPEYDKNFNRYRLQSPILNYGSQTPSIGTIFIDERNLLIYSLKLQGDENGYFNTGREKYLASIPQAESNLNAIHQQFKKYKQQRINQGYESPKNLPRKLEIEKLKIEAKYDVLKEELEEVNRQLKTIEERRRKESNKRVLQYGLMGFARLHGTKAENPELIDVLSEIDGQNVKLTHNGILIIDDERSPYDGMDIPSYRKLMKLWQKERAGKRKQEIARKRKFATKNGLPIPELSCLSLRKVNQGNLPPFPSWAKNHKSKNGKKKPTK